MTVNMRTPSYKRVRYRLATFKTNTGIVMSVWRIGGRVWYDTSTDFRRSCHESASETWISIYFNQRNLQMYITYHMLYLFQLILPIHIHMSCM